jgi:hypothetical protein
MNDSVQAHKQGQRLHCEPHAGTKEWARAQTNGWHEQMSASAGTNEQMCAGE